MRLNLDGSVIAQAEAMIEAVQVDHPGVRERLASNALDELANWDSIVLRMVADNSQYDGPQIGCSVAGQYIANTSPPTLVIAESISLRRRQFTCLHEFGHHLQKTRIDLGRSALAHAKSALFEDAACDVFASRILLPDSLVDAYIGKRGPTAEAVVTLFQKSNASRAACCVRAAERLGGSGAVVLLNSDGVVDFAAASGIYPPARRASQADTPLIAAALAAGESDRVFELDTHISYKPGNTSDQLYGQAMWCDGYLIAVLAGHTAAWKKFAPPKPGTARFVVRRGGCEICNSEFLVQDICSKCSQPLCPDGHCVCTLARERTCVRCSFVLNVSRFSPGSSICLDCA